MTKKEKEKKETPSKNSLVLWLDDEVEELSVDWVPALRKELQQSGLSQQVLPCQTIDDTILQIENGKIDLIIADLRLGDQSLNDLCIMLKRKGLRIPIVVFSGYNTYRRSPIGNSDMPMAEDSFVRERLLKGGITVEKFTNTIKTILQNPR